MSATHRTRQASSIDLRESAGSRLPGHSFCGGRHWLSCLLLALLLGCSSAPAPEPATAPAPESNSQVADELLERAANSEGSNSARLTLDAARLLAEEGDWERLLEETATLGLTLTDADMREELALLRADAALQLGEGELALQVLQSLPEPEPGDENQAYFLLLAESLAAAGEYEEATRILVQLTDTARRRDLQILSDRIWAVLSQLDDDELANFSSSASSYQLRGWIELARSYQAEQVSIRSQLNAVEQWREIWNRHLAMNYLPTSLEELSTFWDRRPRQMALILPLQQSLGVAIQEGFLSAYYSALGVSSEVPSLTVYDSSGLDSITELYERAVAEGAELIIGPLNKNLVNQLHGMERLPVPTLALNYAEATTPGPRNLYQFGLAPEDEINQIARLAWQAGYRNAAILTPDSQDYLRFQNVFSQAWSNLGGQTVATESFSGEADYADVVKRIMAIDASEARADRLLELLPRSSMQFMPRRREDIDFLFLIANPRQGRQIKPTLAFYFAENLPVLAMPSIYDGLDNQSANLDLDGVIFIDAPWLLRGSDLKSTVNRSLRPALGPLQRLRAMGVDTFLLSTRLQQFDSRQITLLRGTTGTLTMSEGRLVHRRLPIARFENGQPTVIRSVSSGDD